MQKKKEERVLIAVRVPLDLHKAIRKESRRLKSKASQNDVLVNWLREGAALAETYREATK